MNRYLTRRAFTRGVFLPLAMLLAVANTATAAELNLYSYRAPVLIQPLLDAYTKETGVKFKIVHAPKGLAQRLKAEGASSPGDVVLTVDISRLAELKDMNLLAKIGSGTVASRVPAHLRDDDDYWTALTTRARIAAVSKNRVASGAISRIEDLADPGWKGKICTRKGSHVYNRALLASMVSHHGEAGAEEWARGLVANLARKPQGNDRAQAKAIFSGECDVAVMNTYYYGKMKFNKKNPEQREWADAINLVFLNQNDRGQHVNISGAGIVATSKNKAEARKFIEWLTDAEAQRIYASTNYEFPVNPQVTPDAEVASWGSFRADTLALSEIAANSPTAQRIIDRVGW